MADTSKIDRAISISQMILSVLIPAVKRAAQTIEELRAIKARGGDITEADWEAHDERFEAALAKIEEALAGVPEPAVEDVGGDFEDPDVGGDFEDPT